MSVGRAWGKPNPPWYGQAWETEDAQWRGQGRKHWRLSIERPQQEKQGTPRVGKAQRVGTLHGGGRTNMTDHPSWKRVRWTGDLGVGRAWETTKPPWQDQARETENPP